MKKKNIVLRVITDDRVIPWHLGKTIASMSNEFDVIVAGDKASTYTLDYPNVLFLDVPIVPKIHVWQDLIALARLVSIIVHYKPDICHSIMPKAALLSAIASWLLVPVRIHTFTGQVWQLKTGFSRFALKMIDKLIVFLNTICYTDSYSQSQFLYSEGVSFRGAPLPVISKGSLGGVDLDKINIKMKRHWRDKVRRDYNISEQAFVIGFLARKTVEKGALLVLEAFRKIRELNPNIILMYIGPDDSNGALESYKFKNPNWADNVIDIGAVSNHEVYIAAFDILCLPSYREGFGSIVIDAAALGVPTVGSRIPGLVDAIEDSFTGLLFDCGDIDSLCLCLIRMLKNNCLVSDYGRNAYYRVIKFYDSAVITKDLEESYKFLLSNSAGKPVSR